MDEALLAGIQAMPTWRIIEQIKGDKTDFLINKNIKYIATSRNNLEQRYFDLLKMSKAGIKAYAFHVDDIHDESYMICHELGYFYRIYANKWDFHNSFNESVCSKNIILKTILGYRATLSEGTIFNKEGYPDFLANVSGISYLEDWGRWSDVNLNKYVEFAFKEALPKNFKLELEIGGYQNVGNFITVKIGGKIKKLKLVDSSIRKYELEFYDIENATTIKIVPPKPTSPKSLQQSNDTRKLGLSFASLRILK
ncbi:DUF7024 domain-containing protein [Gallibacterium salpingitidis]|uniref:DUF7024 domain-containing protein n=1 Tax=Gallibacterium salpingitidis TaxID=505341 RepID=A0A1A7NYK6_9PAST|nr:hypothetical protein [Gallibacterium salpingitidis]OBW95292.1 hypothetical protein QS62_04025 [Gallibacterium salpingitidis]